MVAHVLFCKVTITRLGPDLAAMSKAGPRGVDGVYFGFDERRSAHFVYIPELKRITSTTSLSFCEEPLLFMDISYLSSVTPVSYHPSSRDLPQSIVTLHGRRGHTNPRPTTRVPIQPHAVPLVPPIAVVNADPLVPPIAAPPQQANNFSKELGHLLFDDFIQTTSSTFNIAECIWLIDSFIHASYAVSERETLPDGSPMPKTLSEAMNSTYWDMIRVAMTEEMEGKFANRAFVYKKRPTGRKVMKGKWVFTAQYNEDGSLSKIKTRYVACGYSQVAGIDYDDVFASTLSSTSTRNFLCLAGAEDLELEHIDGVKAFTQAPLDRDLYVECPDGFAPPGMVLLLIKSLEGIKQGAFNWQLFNKTALVKIGLKPGFAEPNIYTHPTLQIRAGIFVDDGLFAHKLALKPEYESMLLEYKAMVNYTRKPAVSFAGISFIRDRRLKTLTIHQQPYIEKLAKKYEGKFTLWSTPVGASKVERDKFDNLKPASTEADIAAAKGLLYLELVGELLYCLMTRVDVCGYLAVLCTLLHSPTKEGYSAALNLLGYLVKTKSLGITYGGKLHLPMGINSPPLGFFDSLGLHTFTDSSWGRTPRPLFMFVVMLNNGAVSFGSKFLKIVPCSSTEAETAGASEGCKHTIFVRLLMEDSNHRVTGATPIIVDNKGTYDQVVKPSSSARTRYFERATNYVRQLVLDNVLSIFLVGTRDMMADFGTKAVERDIFYKCRQYTMNLLFAETPALFGKAAKLVAALLRDIN